MPLMETTDELLGAADVTLSEDGPHALSLRRIAQRAGTSTQAVYTKFGSKAGLADALYRQGFDVLAQALEEADLSDDPVERIVELSAIYRAVALGRPHHYLLMTGRPIPDYVPPAASRNAARRTMQPLVDAVGAAVESGMLDGPAEDVADRLWAAGHGHISLEINELITTDDASFEALCRRLVDGHRPHSVG